MMTDAAWSSLWLWWLIVLFVSFVLVEAASIGWRWVCFRTNVTEWTLSDCVRRWSNIHHWLPALCCLLAALVMLHLFVV